MMITQNTQEVEWIGTEKACRGIVHIACTRGTKAISTLYREEMRLQLLLEFVEVIHV